MGRLDAGDEGRRMMAWGQLCHGTSHLARGEGLEEVGPVAVCARPRALLKDRVDHAHAHAPVPEADALRRRLEALEL
jgi:hypothetical protein